MGLGMRLGFEVVRNVFTIYLRDGVCTEMLRQNYTQNMRRSIEQLSIALISK